VAGPVPATATWNDSARALLAVLRDADQALP
jgi:hypothetical protein